MDVKTAGKLGYCFGVSKAINDAQKYADIQGPSVSLGTVAHNEDVVAHLMQHGVRPIKVEDIQPGMKVIITAHGAPPELYKEIDNLGCSMLDCTCSIVKKAQQRATSLAADEFDIIIFGDPDHQEVKGLVGWAMSRCRFVGRQDGLFTPGQEHKILSLGKKVGVLSQTTADTIDYVDFVDTFVRHHVDDFDELRVYNTICPIVAERIALTRHLAEGVDMMFVVGSEESANTRNLEKVCRQAMWMAYADPSEVVLVQNEDQVIEALEKRPHLPDRAGVTAGTSTPIEVVEAVVAKLKGF
jgi:(E)-4-hydroxy-3-methyl-but-2-enyl pyrophosphate reductase